MVMELKCAKCKKKFDAPGGLINCHTITIEDIVYPTAEKSYTSYDRFIICKDCTIKFYAWMNDMKGANGNV